MAPVTPPRRLAAVPARYAKFITAVVGDAILYVQLYGTTWHLDAALVMAGAALGVLGVPNAPAPAPAPIPGIRPPDPPSGTVIVRPTDGIVPPAGGQA